MSELNFNNIAKAFTVLAESASDLLEQAADSLSNDIEDKAEKAEASFEKIKKTFAESLEEAYNKNRNRKDDEAEAPMKKIVIDNDNYIMINDDEIVIYQKSGPIYQSVRLSFNLFKKINLAVSDFRKDSEGYVLIFKQKDPLKKLDIWNKQAGKIPKDTGIYGHYSDFLAAEKAMAKYNPIKYWKYRVTVTGNVPSIVMNTDAAVSDAEQIIAYTSDIKEAEDVLSRTVAL